MNERFTPPLTFPEHFKAGDILDFNVRNWRVRIRFNVSMRIEDWTKLFATIDNDDVCWSGDVEPVLVYWTMEGVL